VTRFEADQAYGGRSENRCNRRHREFISIFNLIRNSFATIPQLLSLSPLPLPPGVASPPVLFHHCTLHVDSSLDLFQRPPTQRSLLSPVAVASPLPLYFPHGASLSLTLPLPSPSSLSSLNFSLSRPSRAPRRLPRTFYTTYLPLSATVIPSPSQRYLHPPLGVPRRQRPSALICSAKFPEKDGISGRRSSVARGR